eukprot:3110410-Pleurochrysis_carterae.AAC.1
MGHQLMELESGAFSPRTHGRVCRVDLIACAVRAPRLLSLPAIRRDRNSMLVWRDDRRDM